MALGLISQGAVEKVHFRGSILGCSLKHIVIPTSTEDGAPIMSKRFTQMALVAAAVVGTSSVAMAGIEINGISLNGISLNGINLNGISLNGGHLNGINLNGGHLNGIELNGIYFNSFLVKGAEAMCVQAPAVPAPAMTTRVTAIKLSDGTVLRAR